MIVLLGVYLRSYAVKLFTIFPTAVRFIAS